MTLFFFSFGFSSLFFRIYLRWLLSDTFEIQISNVIWDWNLWNKYGLNWLNMGEEWCILCILYVCVCSCVSVWPVWPVCMYLLAVMSKLLMISDDSNALSQMIVTSTEPKSANVHHKFLMLYIFLLYLHLVFQVNFLWLVGLIFCYTSFPGYLWHLLLLFTVFKVAGLLIRLGTLLLVCGYKSMYIAEVCPFSRANFSDWEISRLNRDCLNTGGYYCG